MNSTEAEIRAELAKAMRRLELPPEKTALAEVAPSTVISEELTRHDAPIELLALVSSWGDTLTDEELLHDLRRFNQTGSIFDEAMQ